MGGTVSGREGARSREGARARIPHWVVDALLGVTVSAVVSLSISANLASRTEPDALAYLWAVGLGALMLVRRRFPVIVLGITVFGLFAYYAAGYPAVGVAVPVAAALFSAAEVGKLRWAILASVVVLVVSLSFRLLEGQDASVVVGYELGGHVLLMAAAIAFGDSIRARRELLARSEQLVALTAQQARQDAEAQAQASRIALARDLHDSVGHAISVISLHSEVSREAIARGDEQAATDALVLVKDTSTAVMSDLRRTVTALRGTESSNRQSLRLNDLDALTESIAGIQFTTEIDVPESLSSSLESTVYRVVQEAVTNIARHSDATDARIEIRAKNKRLGIRVADNGTVIAPVREGHGISGMRERVESLGGQFRAQATDRGFLVTAEIPLEEEQ
ncbi:MAG: sensor histidine kinase [Gulosibacter sp.]|uniref:sensor histidine kinase n=1 Tax=Gulosibacter sp. TaxID=2817531 RepID=UPI003F8FCE30